MGQQPAALKRYWAARRSSGGGTIVVAAPAAVAKRKRKASKPKKKHRRRSGRSSGGGVRLLPLALTTGALAYVTSSQGPKFISENLMKLPGSKTFGATAMGGIACLAVDRFVKPNKWLRLAGYAGLVLAATQIGQKGSGFKWLGDDDMGSLDISDLDDVGDDDVGDDDVGDDYMGDDE